MAKMRRKPDPAEREAAKETVARKRPETVSVKSMIKKVSERTRFTQKDVSEVVHAYNELLAEQLSKGRRVYIPDIGTFFAVERPGAERHIPNAFGRGPRTITIPDRKVLRFKPALSLKAALNK
ncbi:hypothetical protein GFC01_06035 [Desulfofundulus thermobenzoicus]|uniref:HU family DNA-binding protein n=1 Tax=Desulfofundulus thermobenzoicus TaxID=29376 RepID=A0A6N7IQK4_9FIRM|nr:HU family DNA-binding protein [Desulfofundulus thermobenzoicus]MQL51829.1 hypothetical protein [Desulfofundulus thermobenzoicus]